MIIYEYKANDINDSEHMNYLYRANHKYEDCIVNYTDLKGNKKSFRYHKNGLAVPA